MTQFFNILKKYDILILLPLALALPFAAISGTLGASIALGLGLILLVTSGDKLVENAQHIGLKLGWSPLLVGVLIVGLGTSLPEILTVIFAAISGSSGLALGNILGSNIANIGLILGLGLAMINGKIHPKGKWLDYIVMLIATVLMLGVVFTTGTINQTVAIGFLAVLLVYLITTIKVNGKIHEAHEDVAHLKQPIAPAYFGAALGLAGLAVGANILVGGAIDIASTIGISERVIGITVVAVGTSLPELAATWSAAKARQGDMILGNVLGSNVFNLLAATGAGGLVANLSTTGLEIDAIVTAAFALLVLPLLLGAPSRKLGMLMVLLYIAYISFNANLAL